MHSPSLSLWPVRGPVSQEKKKKSVIQAPGTISCVVDTGSPLCQSSVVLSPFSTKTVWSSPRYGHCAWV